MSSLLNGTQINLDMNFLAFANQKKAHDGDMAKSRPRKNQSDSKDLPRIYCTLPYDNWLYLPCIVALCQRTSVFIMIIIFIIITVC